MFPCLLCIYLKCLHLRLKFPEIKIFLSFLKEFIEFLLSSSSVLVVMRNLGMKPLSRLLANQRDKTKTVKLFIFNTRTYDYFMYKVDERL